jgi:integrase
VRNAKPKAARYEISDGGGPLRIVVQPSGDRIFAVRFRFNGATRKLTLPKGIGLKAARKLAGDAILQVEQGIDPCAAKREAKAAKAAAGRDTLKSVCADYFRDPKARALRTSYAREQTITRLVYSQPIAKLPIASITRRQINDLLAGIQANNGLRMADVVLAILRRVYRWHQARDEQFSAFPFTTEMPAYKYKDHARSRTLSDLELRAVWRATDEVGVYGLLIKFLVLTSARLGEAAALTWDEIGEDGIWELPASRNKAKVPLARPLPAAVFREVLDKVPRVGPYVFTNGERAFSDFSRWKKRLDAAIGDGISKPWVVHDLRRTASSLMARAGVNPDHRERVLGHVIGGVAGVYNRHDYHAEKARALEALAALIERIVDPPPSNVRVLHG